MLLLQLYIMFILGYIIREQVDAFRYETGYINLYKHGSVTLSGEQVHETEAIAKSRIGVEGNRINYLGTFRVKFVKI